jgi:hypothetical protein
MVFTAPAGCTSVRLYPARTLDNTGFIYEDAIPVVPGVEYTASFWHELSDGQLKVGRLSLVPTVDVTDADQKTAGPFDITEPGQRSIDYWQGDGIDDFLLSAVPIDLSNASAVTMMLAAEALDGSGTRRLFTHGAALGGTELIRNSSNQWRGIYNDGVGKVVDGTDTPRRAVVEYTVRRSGDAELFINGASQGTVAVGAQAFDTEPASVLANIVGGAAAPARFYAGLVLGRAVTSAERDRLTNWFAHRAGVAL